MEGHLLSQKEDDEKASIYLKSVKTEIDDEDEEVVVDDDVDLDPEEARISFQSQIKLEHDANSEVLIGLDSMKTEVDKDGAVTLNISAETEDDLIDEIEDILAAIDENWSEDTSPARDVRESRIRRSRKSPRIRVTETHSTGKCFLTDYIVRPS